MGVSASTSAWRKCKSREPLTWMNARSEPGSLFPRVTSTIRSKSTSRKLSQPDSVKTRCLRWPLPWQFHSLTQIKDDFTTNSHNLTHTFLFKKVGRMYVLNLEVEGFGDFTTELFAGWISLKSESCSQKRALQSHRWWKAWCLWGKMFATKDTKRRKEKREIVPTVPLQSKLWKLNFRH